MSILLDITQRVGYYIVMNMMKNKNGREIKKGHTYHITCSGNETLLVEDFDVRAFGVPSGHHGGMVQADGIRTMADGSQYAGWAYLDDLGSEVRA